MTNTIDKFRKLSASLKADAAALRRNGAWEVISRSYEYAAAKIDATLCEIEAELTGTAPQPESESTDGEGTPVTAEEIRAYMRSARTQNELANAAALIQYVKDAAERESLNALYNERAMFLGR